MKFQQHPGKRPKQKTGHGLPEGIASPLNQEKDGKTGNTLTPENRELLNTGQISDKRIKRLAKGESYTKLKKEQYVQDSTHITNNQTTELNPKGGKTGNESVRGKSKFARGNDGNVMVTNWWGRSNR